MTFAQAQVTPSGRLVRLLTVATLVLGAVTLEVRIGEAADAPQAPPVDEAAWSGRDAEGRWVLVLRSLHAGERDAASWAKFLAGRREWDLLEWLALTSVDGSALDALATADAPTWVRTAVWTLAARDSHKFEGGDAWLEKKRPGLALAWLELHPSSKYPQLKTARIDALRMSLKSKAVTLEDASKYLPPLDPEVVLSALRPPAEVEDLADRPRASPGRVYVHQVQRAIDVLSQSKLDGSPWDERLEALLAHANPRVRSAAALGYAHRDPGSIPVPTLRRIVRDAKEHPEVRSSALLGLSWSDSPAAYLIAADISMNADHPAWSAAVSRLGDLDTGFALEAWKDVAPTTERDRAFLDAQRQRIRERFAAQNEQDETEVALRVATMLERAAWADLSCDPLEVTIVPWTLERLREGLSSPDVRAGVEAAGSSYSPVRAQDGPTVSDRRARIQEYAHEILGSKAPKDEPK